MHKFNYELGMKICFHHDGSEKKGTIIAVDGDDFEVKLYTVDPLYGHRLKFWCSEYELNSVIPDTLEAHNQLAYNKQFIQSKIDLAANSLELAFESLREANKLISGRSGDDILAVFQSEDLDLSKCESILTSHGWSSSSLHC